MPTSQQPMESGFDAASTASDVIDGIDLSGKVAIVTGGYSGIGVETTRALRSAGATVIVPARDRAKAVTTLEGIEVELEELDLLDPSSIDAFADRFLATGRPLHILVNSAGIMAAPLVRDTRGYESQFATNHLGHFQLTVRLWPALVGAGGARVVSVSSFGHHYSPVVFEDPHFEHREYERMAAYGQSKTANVLFAVGVDQRGKDAGIRAFSLHPGSIVRTGLERYLTEDELRQFGVIDEYGNPVLDPARQLKTVEQGAATSVWCAASPQLDGKGGVYCENSDIAPLVNLKTDTSTPQPGPAWQWFGGVMPYAIDPDAADRLWNLSEQFTGATIR